jgi:hypothetical protein
VVRNPGNSSVKYYEFCYYLDMSKSSCGAFYGMGLIGALVYNMQYAHSFKEVMWGLGKTIFWPAVLVYEAFSRLQ